MPELAAPATATSGTTAAAGGQTGREDAGLAEAAASIEAQLYELRFAIEKSLRYHVRRRAHYDRWHHFNAACTLIAASVVVSPWLPWWAFVVAGLVAVSDVVFRPTAAACEHTRLHHEFTRLMIEIHAVGEPGPEQIRRWKIERVRIETQEPPTFCAVEAESWNEVARAWDKRKVGLIPLSWWQRAGKHFLRFEDADLSPSLKPIR